MNKEQEPLEKDESGYSEANSTLQAEIDAGEWERLGEFPTYNNRSRQGKIIATHQAVTNRLNQLSVLYYQLVKNQPQEALKMLKELKRLRELQAYLLNSLVWEKRGEFEEHQIPDELEKVL